MRSRLLQLYAVAVFLDRCSWRHGIGGATETDRDSNGTLYGPYNETGSATWSSSDTSVATVSGGTVSFVGPGSCNIIANWNATEYVGPNCSPETVTAGGGEGATVAPKITSISPSRALFGTVVDVDIKGNGFGSNPSVNAGSDITVSIQGANNSDIVCTFSLAGNGTGGNHAVTVTASGHTSGSVNFYVQIPTSLLRNSITDVIPVANGTINGNPNECGAYRSVSYTLLDQASTQIVTDQPVSETFSNYSGPPSLAPPNKPVADSGGALQGTLGFGTPAPQCPPAFQASLTQRFNVAVGLNVFNLTTSNAISYTSDGAGHYTITVNYTQ
jgi:hypothetical protein